jgi:hypothetical protein
MTGYALTIMSFELNHTIYKYVYRHFCELLLKHYYDIYNMYNIHACL